MTSLLILNTDSMDYSYGGVCPFMRNMHPYLEKSFDVDYLVLPDKWKKEKGPVRVKYLIYLLLNKRELSKYDFILSHSPEGSYMASFSDTPYAHIYHGNSNPMQVGRFRIGKLFAGIYDKMLLLYTVGPKRNERQRKLYNPLNQNVSPIPFEERHGFIFAGRLEVVKNIDRLIRIYAQLPSDIREKNPFYIAGYGSLENELKTLTEELELGKQVVFLGNIPNAEMMKLDADKRILLMASKTEGFPTAIAEALSVGVPVVSTDVGDIASIVKNGENGILLPSGFEDEDYLKAINTVLENYEHYAQNALSSSKVFNGRNVTLQVVNDIVNYEKHQ